MKQTAIELKSEFTDSGDLHVWALTEMTDSKLEDSLLNLTLKSRQTGRTLAENATSGENPLRCDLDDINISEAFENGGSFTAIATLSDNPEVAEEFVPHGNRQTLTVQVLGFKEVLNFDFSYALSLSGDFQHAPKATLHDTVISLVAKDGYEIVGEPTKVKLKYTLFGQGPFTHSGEFTYKDGQMTFSDESQEINQHGDTFLELHAQVNVRKIPTKTLVNPINFTLNTRYGR